MIKTALSLASGRGNTRGLLILTYHRAMATRDPYIDDITKDVFELHASTLSQYCNVVRLDRAAELLAQKSLPSRAVAITFDDGYEDNFRIALPILRTYRLDATFFVATGYLDGGTMWNDIILGAVKKASDSALRAYLESIGQESVATSRDARASLIRQIIQSLKYENQSCRDDAAMSLVEQLGVQIPESPMMSRAQVQELAQQGMEIGAHTVTHPILKCLRSVDSEREIADSRRALVDLTGTPVTSFAYPNGIPGRDFDDTHVEMLKRQNFKVGVTTASARASYTDNLLRLPRINLWHDRRGKFLARLLLHFFQR